MLRQYELVERVKSYDPDADEALINRAYVFSMAAHGSQKRASGDPYYSHPIEVAGILTDLHLDDETIVTAILHDTIEDTVATHADIEAKFGPAIARMVDGVTKLSKIEAQSENERAAENLRKFLLAMSDDIRVLLVKLADRLHNMRTLHFIKDEAKRRRIAKETMDIYAPLAERIGMYEFMNEMQGLAFRELEPDAYASISKRLEQLHAGGGDQIARIGSGLKLLLSRAGIEADVSGREKHPYSIWKKMAERHISFEQLSDVMAFRAIVPDEDACYRALGVMHRRWPMVPGRFKDYISTPKRNGYRSLHTSVIHSEKMRIEIQIRSSEMHAQAEYGYAAHWTYKQGQKRPDVPGRWISDLVEILDNADTPEELLEHTRMAMYQDRIFRVHAEGRAVPAAQGRNPGRFRLCGAHQARQRSGGGQDQRSGRAAPHAHRKRRPGGDPEIESAGAATSVAELRRDRARRAPRSAVMSATRNAARAWRSAARFTTNWSSACQRSSGKEAQRGRAQAAETATTKAR